MTLAAPRNEVNIIIGSKSDVKYVRQSGVVRLLQHSGLRVRTHVCSAHRNAPALQLLIHETRDTALAYIGAAGMAAALPGAIKSLLYGESLVPVFGVALPSPSCEDGSDAAISIQRIPGDLGVIYAGFETDGFLKAAQRIVLLPMDRLSVEQEAEQLAAIRAARKPQQFDIDLDQED